MVLRFSALRYGCFPTFKPKFLKMNQKQYKTIGIIGGMGPFAGLDVNKKLYQNTLAQNDQEHLNVVCLSLSKGLPDRTEFILGKTDINPAKILAEKINQYPMEVVGIACNTFHSPVIFDVLKAAVDSQNKAIQLLHLPEEVRKVAEKKYPNGTIGVLSTLGTYQTNIYQDAFQSSSVSLVFPDKEGREAVHRAIYDPNWGIKRQGNLLTPAQELIHIQISHFIEQGVDAILLGCTELPLVANELDFQGCEMIDGNLVLARALIRAAAPNQLRIN